MRKAMSKFEDAEYIGRQKVIDAILNMDNRLSLTATPINKSYDLCFRSGNTLIGVECKDRNFPSHQYKNVLLSKAKYDYLKSMTPKENEDYEIWYASTFTDGKCYIWDVNETPIETGLCRHHKHTVLQDGMIEEEVVYFEKNDAKYVLEV